MPDDPRVPFLEPTGDVAIRRLAKVTSMSRDELDALPFGVIRVDRDGFVLEYNAAEARLAGREPEDVIGKNFFADVAPCTNVQRFAGRFRTELGPDRPPVVFPYVFEFGKRRVHVTVLMHFDPEHDCGWILVHDSRE